MKAVRISLLLFIVAGFNPVAGAQALPPDLAPVAARHNEQLKAVDAEKSTAVARTKQRYLDELAKAEKAGSASGKLTQVSSILKEREAVNAGNFSLPAPEEFPKTLERPRAEFLSSLDALSRQFQARYEKVNADYLRSLAALEARAGGKPELQKAIGDEKAKLVSNPPSGSLRELTNEFLANSVWVWLPKSPHDGTNDWQLLANGTVSTGAAHFWNWKRSAADRFEIRDGGKLLWDLKMNFAKMEAEEVNPKKERKELKHLKYSGTIPKGKERKQGE